MSPTAVASKVRSTVFVCFAGLTLIGAAYAAPQGVPVVVENPVTIANPTTSVSVNNTVPVTGNVGITGTPNVNITNTVVPVTGNVGVTGAVTVANPVNSVTVNNTTPIPVTGNFTATLPGNVNVGAMPPITGNVGIIGTPNVSVTNTVPVTVTNPVGTVNVANTSSSPIPVTVTNATGSNATDPAKTAYVGSASGSATSTVNQATNIGVQFSPLVPSGMRLIIESISGACSNIPQATTVYQSASIQTTLYPVAPLAEGAASFILMPQVVSTATSTHIEQFSATNLRIYTDATPILNVFYTATGPGVTYTIPCYFSIFGYLVSMP